MKRFFLFLSLLCGTGLPFAAETPRPPFPSDYTPTNCPTVNCGSFVESELRSAAATILGLSLDVKWVHEHLPELRPEFEKICTKVTTCFATPPNTRMFCDDIASPDFRAICDRHFPKEEGLEDHEQCAETVETYLLGLDDRMERRAQATRDCAAKNDPVRTNKTLDVWMVPSAVTLPASVVPITFYAIDRETHVPILAAIAIEGQQLYSRLNPTGSLATGYSFKWPVKYVRLAGADGHEQSIGPTVTVAAEGYPAVTFRMPVEVPRLIVSVEPPAASLRAGKNHQVTISVRDAISGEPVNGRVMAGKLIVGRTNHPFELDLRNRKRPEIWIAQASNGASDVVVSAAK